MNYQVFWFSPELLIRTLEPALKVAYSLFLEPHKIHELSAYNSHKNLPVLGELRDDLRKVHVCIFQQLFLQLLHLVSQLLVSLVLDLD